MSEEPLESTASEDVTTPVSTGVEQVDAVLSEVEALGELPVPEHVAVFEHAHEQLRAALDSSAGDSPGEIPGSARDDTD